MQVADKEWDKYRVAFVLQGKPHYVDEDDKTINTKVGPLLTNAHALICLKLQVLALIPVFQEFKGIAVQGQGQQSGRPWIGLEHTNKVPSSRVLFCSQVKPRQPTIASLGNFVK